MVKEIHDFIIWENTRNKTSFLLEEIKKKFQILEVYEVNWSKQKFGENLRRFYGPTLPDPERKIQQSGSGPFLVIIFADENPIFQFRKTSLGMQQTNTNVYDFKRHLRKFLEGKFPIHGSIHKEEASHDMTLIFGKEFDRIKELKKWDGQIKQFRNDLFGSEGWNSLEDVIYLLNSTTKYVILRNFEKISKELISEEHPDIDILLENPIHVPYMLNQINLIKSKRLPAVVIIDNKEIKFDYRYVGDTYYDEKWSKDILKNRILNEDGIFIPSNEDYFYSLIYHCIIHGASAEKYYDQLQALSSKINIEYNKEINNNSDKLSKLLSEFMKKKNYTYTNSLKYRINHNEFNRLYKVGMFTLKHEGVSGLIRAGKGKIKRKLKK